ncbi:16S rRNA (cytidine(1402)-2'-O)-methyltransferase [uncultured Prochlorococcus sp.]|uniref:16S rRNA (cytidine(1402)-2'-O)-methyltransferase n=1 Tax=uncultured Prochlorococcus sp. TaxID=159733 RepID=UPI00258D266B|nr:16S rRNA (cytidine(1402)-2'-O)-methyltransferase [uncultured Prochlorococcus sp.]
MNINSPLSHRTQEPENSVLYIVGTPIGNLDDISLRALNILKRVTFIACEDTRQTKKLMSKFGISNKLISFHQHNSINKIHFIVDSLKKEKSVALVSDAGMPSICDPGENLIKKVRENNYDVICIPGPCAALTALVSSGFPSSSFIFLGFLPRKKKERDQILQEISNFDNTTILYESPHRFKKLLIELKIFCGGDREIQVFRELTKKYEEQIGMNIDMVLRHFEDRNVVGEITIVINGRKNIKTSEINEFILKKDLTELIDAGLTLSSASSYLAKKKNIKKSLIYNLY